MAKIARIDAWEILDSRGNPTVRTAVTLSNGVTGIASVPSGASTGTHEAVELRDGDPGRYAGNGVRIAVANVTEKIAPLLTGLSISRQKDIDQRMCALDGTDMKSALGANAILSVSLACAHAHALDTKRPLYQTLREIAGISETEWHLPLPTMNIINGGRHADSGLSFQEFMIIPTHESFTERVRIGAEIFHVLKKNIAKKGYTTLVGDEGGFAPRVGTNEKAIQLIMKAISDAGYSAGSDVWLGLDCAASEFYDQESGYAVHPSRRAISSEKMIEYVSSLAKKYPLLVIEDPLAEDDWKSWKQLTRQIGKKSLLVGDDLFVTQSARLARGIDMKAANAILIKLNQVGTLTETLDCIRLAQESGYAVNVSHRSGETADTTIADLAVAVNAEFIKTGSLSRSERVEKYNRLIAIERELGLV